MRWWAPPFPNPPPSPSSAGCSPSVVWPIGGGGPPPERPAMTFLLPLLLATPPSEPTLAGVALPVEAQWAAILACPKISLPGGPSGSGVVVGVKDGFAYLLTAAHAVPVPYDRVEVMFTERPRYPKPAWFASDAEVVARWPDPDVA